MAVDEALNAYSTTASTNTPAGTDSIGTDLDNHLRDVKKNIAYSARWLVQAAKTTTYAVAVTDMHQWVTANTSGGAFSINLVAAATAGDGFSFGVKLTTAGNTLTIDGNGAETIDGSLTYTMDSQYEAVILICDGSNWHIAAGTEVEGDNVDITNTTALTTLADADEVLVYDATATANRKITVANFSAGMDYVLLGTATASADEYITFAEVFTSTYAVYKIAYYDVICTTDLDVPVFELGTGSTPTWIAGTNYTGGWHWIDNNATPQHGFSWAAYTSKPNGRISAYDTGTDASNREQTSGELILMNPASTIASDRQHVRHESWGQNSNSIPYWNTGMTVVVKSAAITSIRFTAGDPSTQVHTAETLASGEFRVYGLRNA